MRTMNSILSLLALGAIALAAPALADTRGVACHGCTADQMRSSAAAASSGGTVYVFNQPGERVGKYFVYFDVDENARRYKVIKVAEESPVEPDLQDAWVDVSRAWQEADDATIVLPPEFPIRTVAGVLAGPNSSETAIEDHLAGASWAGFRVRLLTFFGTMFNHSIPVFSQLVGNLRITIEFADGTTIEAVVQIDTQLTSDGGFEPSFEIVKFDDPRMADGEPVPDRAIQFVGLTFYGEVPELWDWIDWARDRGVTVTGLSGGALPNCPTKMSCSIANSEIRCTVTGSSSC